MATDESLFCDQVSTDADGCDGERKSNTPSNVDAFSLTFGAALDECADQASQSLAGEYG